MSYTTDLLSASTLSTRTLNRSGMSMHDYGVSECSGLLLSRTSLSTCSRAVVGESYVVFLSDYFGGKLTLMYMRAMCDRYITLLYF